jgi:hypothetical protein
MKPLSSLAAAAAGRMRVKKRAPKIEPVEARKAARASMAPLGVFSARLFQCEAILQDRNALLVYLAIANHAKKSGITECSQERIAAVSGASLRTVARKIAKLQQYGLLKKEYSRPIRGNPMHRLNVMRVIFDDGTNTRQDAQAIAGKDPAVTRHPIVAGNPGSYPQGQTPDMPNNATSDNPVTCHIEMAGNPGHANQSLQLHAKLASQVTSQTKVADKQNEVLNNRDILDCINRALVRFRQKPLEFNEGDLKAINGTAITERDITGAVADYLLDCQDQGTQPQPTLPAILGNLLQVH